jgi:hypothetical protein
MSQQDGRNKVQIVEDAPRMRSVAMLQHSTATAFQPHQQSAFGLKTGGGYSGLIGEKAKSAPYAVKLDIKPATIKSWNVTKISSIPPYYQLDRTHVTVSSDVSLKEVTDRLMDVFHSESIAVVYDDNEVRWLDPFCHYMHSASRDFARVEHTINLTVYVFDSFV